MDEAYRKSKGWRTVEEIIVQRMKEGVKYTKFANKFYSTYDSPYGNRLNVQKCGVIRRMLREGKLKIEGTTIKLVENEGKTNT